ncbi:RluA family pseudouridine synthase [Paenibacillus sp. SYP-B3998]|uniref:Pseudouridine synthase n=1 Tax=Paenibacillus sp. SYP-B3998 TaxID=2678564 RepID=A0A6G3ZQK4_9BACL|nr:RluA family pseudouridine synthase [Paenibacillus sp. SYP-B3998]
MDWVRQGEWLELPIPHDKWKPLQPRAIEELEGILRVPRKLFLRLASQGGVRVLDNKLLLHVFPKEKAAIAPEVYQLDIGYEDDFCLVVNKQAGMSIHPAEVGQKGTLAAAVAYYYASTGQACSIRHIHRLDQDTTGAVLYAKNEWAHILLDEAMREKRIDRRYVAIAEGVFRSKQGTIEAPIGKDRHHAGKRRVTPGGDAAVTHYQVLKQMKRAALVELELETGRTHQIRVHLHYLGHPLIGDSLYGGSTNFLRRQALHGERLLFDHPVTRKQIVVQAAWPQDMLALLEKLNTL